MRRNIWHFKSAYEKPPSPSSSEWVGSGSISGNEMSEGSVSERDMRTSGSDVDSVLRLAEETGAMSGI
jgi:hypothetical protein